MNLYQQLVADFYKGFLRMGFDRRIRRPALRDSILLGLIFMIMAWYVAWKMDGVMQSESESTESVPRYQWHCTFLITTGIFLAMVVEYTEMINSVSWILLEMIALVAFMTMYLGGAICLEMMNPFRPLGSFQFFFSMFAAQLFLFFLYFSFRKFHWFFSIMLAIKPCLIRVRRPVSPGQPNQQPLELLVWYNMDLCTVIVLNPNQLPQGFPIQRFRFPEYAWPSMDELPWWISMKLSKQALAAG